MYTAAYLILIKDKKVLLSQRSNTGFKDGMFGLPSGHVENNETIVEALIREAKEEIGIDICYQDVQFTHVMNRFSETGRTYNDFYFTVKKWKGNIENREPEKCSNLSWFHYNELPENIIEYVGSVLNQKSKYSELKN